MKFPESTPTARAEAMTAFIRLRDTKPVDALALERARNVVVTSNLRLIRGLSRDWLRGRPHLEADDLIAVGTVGLIQALETFDPSRSSLSHWVGLHVSRGFQREVREAGSPVHIPDRVFADRAALVRARAAFETVNGRTPMPEELARDGLPAPKVAELLALNVSPPVSVDTPTDEDGYASLREVLQAAAPEVTPEQNVDRRARLAVLGAVLASMPARERRVLLARAEGHTLASIAAELGISPERARQVEASAEERARSLAMARLRMPRQPRHATHAAPVDGRSRPSRPPVPIPIPAPTVPRGFRRPNGFALGNLDKTVSNPPGCRKYRNAVAPPPKAPLVPECRALAVIREANRTRPGWAREAGLRPLTVLTWLRQERRPSVDAVLAAARVLPLTLEDWAPIGPAVLDEQPDAHV